MKLLWLVGVLQFLASQGLITYLGNRKLIFDASLLTSPGGVFEYLVDDEIHDIEVDANALSMDIYSKEDSLPVSGLLTYALKSRHQSIEVLYCKEYASSYSALSTKVAEYNQKQCECIDWMSTCGVSIATLPRPIVHEYNILHRGIGVLVMDDKNRLFIHQRASTKRVFPSMYDMFIGGVSAAGESSTETLLRELKEEIGLDLQAGDGGSSIESIGTTTIETGYNHCIVDCFVVRCSLRQAEGIQFRDGEVQWGEWMELDDFRRFLCELRQAFVPDGLQVWEALAGMKGRAAEVYKRAN